MRLYVNVDHVATLRQARQADEPDPLEAARVVLQHGADGITFHLREDRRHIQDDDARRLVAALECPVNFELAARREVIDLACELRPFQATLVPESRQEVTTEGGLDIAQTDIGLRDAITRLQDVGIRVALFIDPERASVERAAELGVPAIELHTGRYANHGAERDRMLAELMDAAHLARGLGLAVHAGHGLTRNNVGPVAAIPGIEELNIGHSIIARSITIGIGPATREIRDRIDRVGR
ncbi:MAG TPA: pyridoxine 5'-phosphate synthase [Gemmatimonadales bacterium]|nr:pyridoxine 5'-phosphate synthase [Gemmatimonadales bacterium]